MFSTLHVIQAQLEHLAQVASLFDGYRQFYRKESDLEAAKQFITSRLQQKDSIIYIAQINGQAAGFTQLYPSFSSVSMQRLWILNDLYVASDFRKMGVAQALIQQSKQMVHDTNAKGLMLETEANNVSAQSLYEKENFVKSDYYTYYWTK